MIAEKFRSALSDGLVKALDDGSSELGARITRDSLGLLGVAAKKGRLTSVDLELPHSYLLADMMTAAGLFTKGGDKMHPTHYIITDKGRDVYSV